MKEVLYIEVPTPNTGSVKSWLHNEFVPIAGKRVPTPDGIRIEGLALKAPSSEGGRADGSPAKGSIGNAFLPPVLSVIVWNIQRTTYLKVFRWSLRPTVQEDECCQHLFRAVRQQFPPRYPDLPDINLSNQSIFQALAPYYPKTVEYFQRMPNGEVDLERVYRWEKRWRESVQPSQVPKSFIFQRNRPNRPPDGSQAQAYSEKPYDLVVLGGALGAIQATLMAQKGYRVLLVERLPFERMHRAWNMAQSDLRTLVDVGLCDAEELETIIGRQYLDGFNKFFDANIPENCRASVLHTPTMLNIAVDAESLLKLCGDKLIAAGGQVQDRTEFLWAEVDQDGVNIYIQPEKVGHLVRVRSRFLVDAMGTASPIEWQLNGGRAFDNVCPSVGACISGGLPRGSWDARYGDFLSSCGDIARGRQLIWKLLPGAGSDLTVYLFHYHEIHPDNSGSLLDLYEDFFHILPEYRHCNLEKLTWRKPTFGYIPGHFKLGYRRRATFDRLITLGDAATLQSPLIFSGFGNLVRRLPGLVDLIDTALRHDLWQHRHLQRIRRFQSGIALTWLLSKGMMIPAWQIPHPSRVNTILNTVFRVLNQEETDVAERFIKDRSTWVEFNRIVSKAAYQNPKLLVWLWETSGPEGIARWLLTYLNFTAQALLGGIISGLPRWLKGQGYWLERLLPTVYFWLLSWAYRFEVDWMRESTPTVPTFEVDEPAPTPSRSPVSAATPQESENGGV